MALRLEIAFKNHFRKVGRADCRKPFEGML